MPRIFNERNVTFKRRDSPIPEFSWLSTTGLSEIVDSKNLYFDIRSLDPDKFSYPYHFHKNAEEIFIVLSGEATLRTPDGFKVISQGDIVFMEIGPTGAHQLYNHSETPCVYLDIRTASTLDVCEYPDSGKINILPQKEIYKVSERVDYYLNEEKTREMWPKAILK